MQITNKNAKAKSNRHHQGSATVEMAAAIAVLLPIVFLLIYAVWQACFYLFIVNTLAEAARQAARGCAIAYGANAGGPIGTADSQGPNAAPAQPSAVYTVPTTFSLQGTSGVVGASPATTPNQVFGNIRVGDLVTDNSQFIATYTPPAPNNQDPSYAIGRVNVRVTYNGPFPRPDPLGLGTMLSTFTVQQAYSYTLEF
jgi:hypothetical protein